jgi:guanylate kinase
VKQKLKDAQIIMDFTPEQTAYVARLGGRASDLESVSCLKLLTASILTAYDIP